MTGKIYMYGAEIEQSRRKVLFQLIRIFALFFDRRDEWTAVDDRNIKTLHGRKDTVLSVAIREAFFARFEYMNEWKKSANIYEVNMRQYTPEGNFSSFARELPRLRDMGVQVLWFMPITPIAEKNKKGVLGSPYACSDYVSVNREFGTLADFRALVTLAHGMGFKVIIDWVANHTGWDHVWTVQHPEFYLRNSETGDFKAASGMDDIIELDYSNPALRHAMIDAMMFWVRECDIDGFRCDLAAWVQADFWQQARPVLDAYKPLFWLGEFDELDNPEHGRVFDASYSWNWMHRSRDYRDGKLSLPDLEQLLHRYSNIGDGSMRAWFTSNHDENSWNGTEYDKYGALAIPLAVFSATWNGIPLLYSGQEMPNRKRLAFFEKDTIEWTGEYALHNFYKTLLQLHATQPALRGGEASVSTSRIHTSHDDAVFAFLRQRGDNEVLVILNFSEQAVSSFYLQDERVKGKFQNAFSLSEFDFDSPNAWHIEAGGYFVYVRR